MRVPRPWPIRSELQDAGPTERREGGHKLRSMTMSFRDIALLAKHLSIVFVPVARTSVSSTNCQ